MVRQIFSRAGIVKIANFLVLALGGIFVLALSGCGGSGGGRSGPSAGIASTSAAPVQIGRTGSAGTAVNASVLGPLDDAQIAKAVENYRLSKKRARSPYKTAGVDLNGDGTYEAIVLFEGKDWCTKTGCSMAIFQKFSHGFRPISRTVRVKAPVEVSVIATNAYRDLLVQTGGGPVPERRVRLRFTGSEYSRNAMLLSEVPLGTAERTETAIAEGVAPAASTARR